MSLKVGIVGLPNVGKSTLFNALLKKRVALSANYPFATIEPNTGIVAVPDGRLQVLSELVQREEKMDSLPPLVPAVVEFVDIAGLVKGASTGAGLGNQFLSHIREVDAIIHVLRDFEDANIVREGSTDPKSDREIIETELALADLQVLEKLLGDKSLEKDQRQLLIEIQQQLEMGKVLGRFTINDERLMRWFKKLPLLTIKPILYVFNVDENELRVKSDELRVKEDAIAVCARLEEEMADFSDEERMDYLRDIGMEETGLERLIRKAYKILGLISYLTAGKKEIRAWTVREGAKAPEAAGVIHTDFEKKFIRAEVVDYDKLIEAGSHAAAKTKGWVRTEGKEYFVKDGDVIEFLIGS